MGLKIKTSELKVSYPCKAFYSISDSTMAVGIKRKGKYKSHIESDFFSMDLTVKGQILNIDVWKPKAEWQLEKNIAPPEVFKKKDLRFMDHPATLKDTTFFTNDQRSLLHIRIASGTIDTFVSPANSLIFELDESSQLLGFWITDIEDDNSYEKEAIWRASVKEV